MAKKEAVNEIKFGDSPEKVIDWLNRQLEETKNKVIIADGWCKRCGLCISICPVKALDRESDGLPGINNEKCISCGTCEAVCPDFAIIVTNLKGKNKAK